MLLEIKLTIGLDAETKELIKAYIQAHAPIKYGVDYATGDDHTAVATVKSPAPTKKSATLQPLAEDDELAQSCPFDADKKKDPAIDIEDVRAKLATAKHTYGLDKIKPILKKYGKGDLASVPANKYAELLADIDALGE